MISLLQYEKCGNPGANTIWCSPILPHCTARLVANKEFIAHGAGILAVPEEQKRAREEHLLDSYATGDEPKFTAFLLSASVERLVLPQHESAATNEA